MMKFLLGILVGICVVGSASYAGEKIFTKELPTENKYKAVEQLNNY